MMRRPIVVTVVAALAAVVLGGQNTTSARGAPLPGCNANAPAQSAAEAALLREINQKRKSRGATPLKKLTRLVADARQNNSRMASKGTFAHPPNGLTFGKGRRAAQNLAFMPNAESAFAGFMGSPPHRTNMLHKRWRTIGVGAMSCRGMLIFTVNITA